MSLLRASMRDILCRGSKPGSFEQARTSESRALGLPQNKTRSYDPNNNIQVGGRSSASQLLRETRTTPSRSHSVGPPLDNAPTRIQVVDRLPPRLITQRNPRHHLSDDSSDGSDGEEDHIVQIESPSSLFHNSFSDNV